MQRIAYFMGGLMLLDGLWGFFSPRSGFAVWRHYLRPYLPQSLNRLYADYSQLSDGSIRYLSAWAAIMGLFILALANAGRPSAPIEES